MIRDDKEGKADNHIFDWEAGDEAETDRVFDDADVVVVTQEIPFQRVHPCPLETCGAVADFDAVTGKLRLWCTTQAPHAHRTLYAIVAGLPEHKIQVIAPDIGGGFGNKVPIYPGYVCAIVGSILTGKPVKWMEDRTENLTSTGFARDYLMRGRIAADRDGRIRALRVDVLADHGAFNATAQPTKYPAGFFHIFTGSYDLEAAYCTVKGVYTNKAPGGVAYRCSFRVTEAAYLVERMVDLLADELGMDPAELRLKNFIRPEQFPYTTKTGWTYDSGDYRDDDARGDADRRLRRAAARAGREAGARRVHGHRRLVLHRDGRRRPARARWTSPASAWPTAPSCACTRPARRSLRISVKTQGQGHETTFAQIVAEELGIPPEDVEVVHGDTDQTPFGLGTYGSRSTPVSGAATAMVSRKIRDKARLIAAAALEVSPDDLEWEKGRWFVKGDPEKGQTIQEIALASHGTLDAARGGGGPPRRGRRLRPAEPHLSRTAPTSASSTSTPGRARSSCAASSRSTTAACASTR